MYFCAEFVVISAVGEPVCQVQKSSAPNVRSPLHWDRGERRHRKANPDRAENWQPTTMGAKSPRIDEPSGVRPSTGRFWPLSRSLARNCFRPSEMPLRRQLPGAVERRADPQKFLGLRKMRGRLVGYRRCRMRAHQYGRRAPLLELGLLTPPVFSGGSMKIGCPIGGTANWIPFVFQGRYRPAGSLPCPPQTLWRLPSTLRLEKAATTSVRFSRTSALFGFRLSPLDFSSHQERDDSIVFWGWKTVSDLGVLAVIGLTDGSQQVDKLDRPLGRPGSDGFIRSPVSCGCGRRSGRR